MKFIPSGLQGVVVIEPAVFEDDRGWFMESFSECRFHEALSSFGLPIPKPFVQDNQSLSKKGVLRGLHYQLAPHSQGKLVSVVQGAVFDVAVDIRVGSPSFGKSFGIELSAQNKKMLWIPEGFAHGFVALQENTIFHYKTTSAYNKSSERSLRWDDTKAAIEWPFVDRYIISDKDRSAPSWAEADFPIYEKAITEEVRSFEVIGDDRGSLVALVQSNLVPFIIKRVYYLFGTQQGVSRGFHAHRQLEQMAVCVAGRCRMTLDDGSEKREIWLDRPDKGVLIGKMIWHEMHEFSEDCVLMVLASDIYDESDYIRRYDEFISLLR